MRVLLSGGKKTYNIIDGIKKKFTTSGDDFVVIEYLDDIMDMFSRGDYFDKAVIIEQSITRDGAITDEMQIRQRINKFSMDISKKVHKSNYVFLSQDRNIAGMIYDEILPIANDSAVVLMGPPYKATFFADLIVKEAADLPRDWVFEPELAVPEDEDFGFNDETTNNNNADTADMDLGMDLPEMPTNDVFSGYDYPINDNNTRIGDDLGINEGLEADNTDIPDDLEGMLENTGDMDTGDDTQSFGNEFEGGFKGDLGDNFGNDFGNNNGLTGDNWDETFGNEGEPVQDNCETDSDEWNTDNNNIEQDTPIETDIMEPIKQSDELPDYTENNTGVGFIPGFDDENDMNWAIDTGINGDGFDDIYDNTVDNTQQQQDFAGNEYYDDQGNNQNQDFGNDMYQNNEQNNFVDNSGYDGMYNEQPQDSMYGEQPQDNMYNEQPQDSMTGFGGDMYDDTQTSEQSQEQGNMSGFSGDMYRQDAQDEYQATMENDMYNGNHAGFDQQSYDQAAMMAAAAAGATAAAAANMNQQVPQQTMQVQKKKGIRGLFGRGQNNQAQYQNMTNQLNTAQPVQSWQQDNQAMVNMGKGNNKVDINYIKQQLRPFASRGNSIVVTGCGGCGTSTVAYNLANIINQLGYTVLLVDMDTEGRTQSYISKTNYDSMEPDGANLMSAVNSSNGISAQESIVKQGFHLLTMGLGTDTAPVSELLHKEKISRFVNLAKTSHNFVIYDIPFNSAIGFLSEITYMTDNLVLVADASNWGITKLMLNVCNISLDDMQDTIFSRAQLVFNRYRNLTKLLGKKVRTGVDITKVVDMKVQELIGEDPGFHFEDLHIAGIINDDPDIENGWFDNVQYSDTPKGQAIFIELLEHIVLKK